MREFQYFSLKSQIVRNLRYERKCAQDVYKRQCEYIAAGPTAKTVIHLLLLAHRKRGRLLIMEWTESKIRTSLFLKFHIARDYIYNIIS